MREEELLKVVNKQNEKNVKVIRENLRKVLEEEFVMSNLFRSFLDYIDKGIDQGTIKQIDIEEAIKKNGPLTKKLKDFDISRHIAGSSMYLHKHTYIEIDYVYKGSCTYYIDNEDLVFQLKEKELCIINQNVIHGIDAPDEENIILKLMVPFEYIDMSHYREIGSNTLLMRFFLHALNDNLTRASFIVYHINEHELAEELMYRMFCEYLEQPVGWRQSVRNYLSSLLITLMRAKDYEIIREKDIEEENLNITKVISCIQKNYQYITLKDIAKDLHFHENYLSRMIRQNAKVSFRELLAKIRLQEAQKLLENTNTSVTEIALQVGYHKPNFFFKLFKDHYGMTPLEYRKQYIEKKNGAGILQ